MRTSVVIRRRQTDFWRCILLAFNFRHSFDNQVARKENEIFSVPNRGGLWQIVNIVQVPRKDSFENGNCDMTRLGLIISTFN